MEQELNFPHMPFFFKYQYFISSLNFEINLLFKDKSYNQNFKILKFISHRISSKSVQLFIFNIK